MLRNILLICALVAVSFAIISDEKESDTKSIEDSEVGHGFWRHKFGHHGRHHGHHGHHFRFPFHKNVTEEAKKEFFQIAFYKESTKAQIKENVKQWAIKYQLEEEVSAFYAKRKQFFIDHNKNVTEAIGHLEEARDAIIAIFKDDSLTHKQTFEKVHEVTKGYSHELRALLFATRPHFHGRHHRFGHRFGGKKILGNGPQIPSDNDDAQESNDEEPIDLTETLNESHELFCKYDCNIL